MTSWVLLTFVVAVLFIMASCLCLLVLIIAVPGLINVTPIEKARVFQHWRWPFQAAGVLLIPRVSSSCNPNRQTAVAWFMAAILWAPQGIACVLNLGDAWYDLEDVLEVDQPQALAAAGHWGWWWRCIGCGPVLEFCSVGIACGGITHCSPPAWARRCHGRRRSSLHHNCVFVRRAVHILRQQKHVKLWA